jgi:hypothetical protein
MSGTLQGKERRRPRSGLGTRDFGGLVDTNRHSFDARFGAGARGRADAPRALQKTMRLEDEFRGAKRPVLSVNSGAFARVLQPNL